MPETSDTSHQLALYIMVIYNMDMEDISLKNCIGFNWDSGNLHKNWDKHLVSRYECEQVFFNEPFLLFDTEGRTQREIRHFGLGITDDGRRLFIVFTIRQQLIRVISARDMSKKERKIYDET